MGILYLAECIGTTSCHGACGDQSKVNHVRERTSESQPQVAPIRVNQLARIFPPLATVIHVILTGDFSFCSTWDENRHLDPKYQDLWVKLREGEPDFTEDTDRNTMRLLYRGKPKQVRFDRILLRSDQPGWKADSIQLIGTEPIDHATPNIFPSDHFGLTGRFVWQPQRIYHICRPTQRAATFLTSKTVLEPVG